MPSVKPTYCTRVNPRLWEDHRFRNLTNVERLAYLALATHKENDGLGIYALEETNLPDGSTHYFSALDRACREGPDSPDPRLFEQTHGRMPLATECDNPVESSADTAKWLQNLNSWRQDWMRAAWHEVMNALGRDMGVRYDRHAGVVWLPDHLELNKPQTPMMFAQMLALLPLSVPPGRLVEEFLHLAERTFCAQWGPNYTREIRDFVKNNPAYVANTKRMGT